MADTKITALAAITTVDPAADVLPIVDISDTSMAASGTTKKITSNQILGAGGTATLASATITGDLTVDTSTLKVDSANNRVGIGTASPSYLLDVQAATAVANILSTTGTNTAYLQISNTGGYFYLGRENSAGTTFAAPAYSAVLYAGGAYPLVTTVNGGERYRIASDGVATWSNVGGVAGTAMTLNSTGLGVGASPSERITVNSSTAANYIKLTNSGATTGFLIGCFNTTVDIRNKEAGAMNFFTSDTQRMQIDSAGNVGVGVTPSAKLDIAANASDIAIFRSTGGSANDKRLTITSGGSAVIFNVSDNSNTATARAYQFNLAGSPAMTLDASGNLILLSSNTPATLTTNGQLTVNATSNTNLRFSYRGSDGVTRVANLTLA